MSGSKAIPGQKWGHDTRLLYWPVILCIFMCRAWMRPFANLCFAMMQRMWSAKMKLACRMGKGLACGFELGLWMMMFRALLSSSTPDTCMSWESERDASVTHWCGFNIRLLVPPAPPHVQLFCLPAEGRQTWQHPIQGVWFLVPPGSSDKHLQQETFGPGSHLYSPPYTLSGHCYLKKIGVCVSLWLLA